MDVDVHRIRILDGAVTVLDSGHCADLTITTLARSVRMSKTTLYKYFRCRDDILFAVTVGACDRAECEADWATAGGTPFEQLTELAAVIARHGQRLPRALVLDRAHAPPLCVDRLSRTNQAFYDTARVILAPVPPARMKFPVNVASHAVVSTITALVEEGTRTGDPSYPSQVLTVPRLLFPELAEAATAPARAQR